MRDISPQIYLNEYTLVRYSVHNNNNYSVLFTVYKAPLLYFLPFVFDNAFFSSVAPIRGWASSLSYSVYYLFTHIISTCFLLIAQSHT